MKLQITLFLSLFLSLAHAQDYNLDSIKAVADTAKGDIKIKSLIDLCWEYRFINADTARIYGLKGLELAQKGENKELEAYALHSIGSAHEAQGNYTEALEYELKALKIRRRLGNKSKIAASLNNIGIIHDERGNFKDALEYYHEAHQLYTETGEQSLIAMVLVNIGIVLKEQKDYRTAVNYYREASLVYKKLGKEFGMAACHANLGSVFFYLNEYDSALHYSLLATEEFRKQNIQQFLPSSLCNAGMALHKLKRLKEAKEYLIQSKKLNEQYDNKKELAFAIIYLAEIYREEGNINEAERLALNGLEIANKINAQQQVMEARETLSDIYLTKGDFSKALDEHKKYVSLKDTLFNQEKSKQIAELQTRYETEKKEGEILSLKQENDLKESRLERNQILVVLLVIGITGLILLGYLWRNRLVLKQSVEIEATKATLRQSQLEAVITSQEEERRRFAADLHDGMGQLISAVKLNLSKDHVEKNSLNHAVEVLNEMNTEIRNIAFNLMPQVLIKGGLTEALTELATRVNRAGKIQMSVSEFDLPDDLSADKKVALYRVCQEWVNNVIKYSQCTKINLQLVQHEDELVITLEDDGNGFEAHSLSHSKGNGWRNINSRLTLVNGQIDIDSQPGRNGTTVTISVPSVLVHAA
ncbi:MAG TPA: tetratricopeptide repeat protein [Cyclobacteriaceae bacterium]